MSLLSSVWKARQIKCVPIKKHKTIFSVDLESKTDNLKLYALTIYENTDAADIAHLAIFIRGTDNKYSDTEEMASLVP